MIRALCSSLILFAALLALAKAVFECEGGRQQDVPRVSRQQPSDARRATMGSITLPIKDGPPSKMLHFRRPADRPRGLPATAASGEIRLVNPAAHDRVQMEDPDTVAIPRRRVPLYSPSDDVNFDPETAPAEPVFRLSRKGSVGKRPVPKSSTKRKSNSPSAESRRESLRDTFDRLSPQDIRTRRTPESEDGAVVPITETADWFIPLARETKEVASRKHRIRQCLDFYYDRPLNTAEDSSWSMMHHMIAWGRDSKIYVGPPGGRVVSTIGWMCANGVCDRKRLLYVRDGEIRAKLGPGLQGHRAQFLAMLAQARVHLDQPIRVESRDFTVRDLLLQEQAACVPRSELTFTLIGGAHYLHTDTKWTSARGQKWSIPRLMYEEMRQPINGVTCGGTHRLMGLSYAIRRREADGYPIDGTWEKARRFTHSYQNLAFKMQNRDGAFSSDFWRSRGSWGDLNRKLKTTGHTLEWLVFSLPHEELQSPRLTRAVDYLTNLLTRNRYYDWENGPLGHGIRALSLYDERLHGAEQGARRIRTASANRRGPEPSQSVSRSSSPSARNSNSNSNSNSRSPRIRLRMPGVR